ncbi:MAG TPA: HAMP domain-containing sensor histidine kinase [Thermoleophilaceae bacterium]|nr:HAMP domain-containing sensor histidine kinase [Thermoleophilaceae bacterium]
MSLRARIFVANAAVTAIAAAVLLLTPATVSSPAHLREIAIIVGGLLAILVINLVLLSRALSPLERLAAAMGGVELLNPGRRIPVYGSEAEIVDLTRSFNEMLDRLEAERHGSIRRSLEAQESERGRVAQELHDEVGQSLTAVLLHLDRLVRIAPNDIGGEIAEARETARRSLEDVRAIAKRLRPEALDDLGLHSALVALCERLTEQTGIRIERHVDRRLPDISPECELVIYRVAQEAMTNALRHADATRIELSLTSSGALVTLTVADDGRGIGDAEPGTGIQGMRERAVMVGARISLDIVDGAGTAVTLQVPGHHDPA